jgi:hypothetical protein
MRIRELESLRLGERPTGHAQQEGAGVPSANTKLRVIQTLLKEYQMITKQHIATFPALAPAKVRTAPARRHVPCR